MDISRIKITSLKLSHQLLTRYRRSFYIWLAIILSVFFVADLESTHLVRGMQNSTFDLLMRYRVHYPLPDRDILIVDIDEASLKILANRFGRWPWSREVLAKVARSLNSHQPKAIVFDILFSEPDPQNPNSDASFAQLVASTKNIFVPMVLLDEMAMGQTPGKSIPSATKTDQSIPANNITVALPYFYQQLAAQQLGTDNTHPDQDGTIRHFLPWQFQNGWTLPSMPVQVSKVLGFQEPDRESLVINWRGPAYSYRFISFSALLEMIERGDDQRLQKQIAGKIVLIGSTATSLFDLRTTPVAKIHPGVEIMATTIDNFKNHDYLRELPRWSIALLSVGFVWLLAWSFYTRWHASISDVTFIVLQLGLVAVSYVALNLTNVYLDMTIPITAGLVYFSIARVHAAFALKAQANQSQYFFKFELGDPVLIAVMAAEPDQALDTHEFLSTIDSAIAQSKLGVSRIAGLFEMSTIVGSTFDHTALLYWIVPSALAEDVVIDAQRIRKLTGMNANLQLHSTHAMWRAERSFEDSIRRLIAAAVHDLSIANSVYV